MEMGTVASEGTRPPDVARDVFVRLAIAAMAGIVLGRGLATPRLWLAAGVGLTVITAVQTWRGRDRAARHWGWLAALLLSASWFGLRTQYLPSHHLLRHVTDEAQLAEVVGIIDGPPMHRSKERGPFGAFNWEPPATSAVLEVESVTVDGRVEPAEGKLLLRIGGTDPMLRAGQRIIAHGWLAPIEGPANPGEFDYRHWFAQRDIVGRLSMPSAANRQLLTAANLSPGRAWRTLRQRTAAAADHALTLGLEDQPMQRALLQTLLLGQGSDTLEEVEDDFRRVGLAHILSISGAHLAILMGLVWMLLRLLVSQPSRAAQGALVILLVYLMALPINVPILRSAIMAGTFCVGYGLGRRASGLSLLALSCIIVLIWRPMELFSAGFQLSFGIVAALMLFARPVSHRIWPPPTVRLMAPSVAEQLGRRAVDYVAVSLVAFAVALPVVAYHFQLISPHAVLLSILSLPVITVLLGLGYFKILVGLVLPSGSILLSGPLAWVTDCMLGLVTRSADWPGAAIELRQPPSLLWTWGALAAVVALLSGRFIRRRTAMTCTAVLLGGWMIAGQHPAASFWLTGAGRSKDAATLTMFAVGDGSCFLLRLPDHTLMFDCGSAAFFDIGEKTLAPALGRLGVRRIDTLILSHADLDHFSGSLDVADLLPIGRVLVPPQLLAEARDHPAGATAYLVDQLRQRGLEPRGVTQGWHESIGDARLELLWPPTDLIARWTNDTSLVLSVRTAGRRLLLNGDIQKLAITALLDRNVDLRADITDLPHHGSFVEPSPRWLDAVDPQVVLQSSGRSRLYLDKWADTFAGRPTARYITAYHGMVTVRIDRSGHIDIETFRQP